MMIDAERPLLLPHLLPLLIDLAWPCLLFLVRSSLFLLACSSFCAHSLLLAPLYSPSLLSSFSSLFLALAPCFCSLLSLLALPLAFAPCSSLSAPISHCREVECPWKAWNAILVQRPWSRCTFMRVIAGVWIDESTNPPVGVHPRG